MRLISTKQLKPGDQLHDPVYNERGDTLIQRKIPLTVRMIQRLIGMGISFVYVEDPATEDVVMVHPISKQTRRRAVQQIRTTFNGFEEEKLKKSFHLDEAVSDFTNIVRDILSDLHKNKDAINLLSEVIGYDSYIFSHSVNVTIYSLALGLEMKMPQRRLEEIGLGAILHDIGKMYVPHQVLNKPGKLDEQEFQTIKEHTTNGFQLLRSIPAIPLVAAHCAYQHHERLDGSGYPRGISSEDIHQYGKLMAVTDVFDAVTSNRVYRQAMLPHEGMELLYSGAGTLFDSRVVEAFRRTVVLYPNGITIKLSDGTTGVVIRQNKGLTERPVVRILEEAGRKIQHPYEVDLSKELSLMVIECHTQMKEDESAASLNTL
ncbi:HD-GYP domain-containing protein [Bacillus marinisedimentorum]|uniref:HD-GYP domain-containing protein n=1 Tax=Bacillus marinisedimentorum TaxID=1821260 RepID=UPI000872F270|nr:HD-GYP domain-containing protein [Bacillus marinisedimentorum]